MGQFQPALVRRPPPGDPPGSPGVAGANRANPAGKNQLRLKTTTARPPASTPVKWRAYCRFRGKQRPSPTSSTPLFSCPRTSKTPAPKRSPRPPAPGAGNAGGNPAPTPARGSPPKTAGRPPINPFPLPHLDRGFPGPRRAPRICRQPRPPPQNLNLSSFYFPLESPVHKISRRGYWDGRDFDPLRFSTGVFSFPDSDISVGFRCVKKGIRVSLFSLLLPALARIPLDAWDFDLSRLPSRPQILDRPPGVRRALLSWREKRRKACLFYQIPPQKKLGPAVFAIFQAPLGMPVAKRPKRAGPPGGHGFSKSRL